MLADFSLNIWKFKAMFQHIPELIILISLQTDGASALL